ncbi:hypothetical protein T08_16117 [Trichinella sp. T8]|nr:hypothetical protein T08_16117 [Trichinella sp. T8]
MVCFQNEIAKTLLKGAAASKSNHSLAVRLIIFPAVNKYTLTRNELLLKLLLTARSYNVYMSTEYCRIVELTTPVSDRVTSQTVTGDDLSFQAVLKQMRPLNALHIVDDKFEYTKYVTSITYLHTASCFLPLVIIFAWFTHTMKIIPTCTANALRKSGPPYDLGLVVIADDTLWLGKGKVLVQFG